MKKKKIIGISVGIVVLLTACGITVSQTEAQNLVSDSVSSSGILQTSFESQGIAVTVDAIVDVPENSDVEMVILQRDNTFTQNFIKDKITDPYPEVVSALDFDRESWMYMEGNNVKFMAGINPDGWVDFTDVVNDISAPYVDGNHTFEYGYITDLIPAHMNITGEEAAELLSVFLTPYTSLEFRPWNILAAQDDSRPDQSGYYGIAMQAHYKDIPINVRSDIKDSSIGFTGFVSDKGIFAGYGALLLSLKSDEPIKEVLSLEKALEEVQDRIGLMAYGNAVKITKISFEYIPELTGDSDYLLRPAWVFYCCDTDSEGNEMNYQYTIYAEDGSFCGIFF